ncbi:MAG: Prolipoprotein diacylglyceryl transferase [Chlamydiae bacterium]|nr:Prolipoprotein diacylglyceryl transferase [Chlamydiota bacterium]
MSFVVDPDRIIFTLPYLNHPVTWYGLLFAFGFFAGYFLIRKLLADHLEPYGKRGDATMLADRLCVLVIIGTVIGARLGHVFFYGWPFYRQYPFEIFKVWRGGLASHGGAVGILSALAIFFLWHRKKYPSLTFLALLDALLIPAAFVSGCIRIGNFINQEILGIPTTLPWGVTFMHPADGLAGVPLHPVQLYESFFYFLTFGFLLFIWQRGGKRLGLGIISGWFFVLVFGFRFFIEYLKLPQSLLFEESSWLNMGQILSIPFIALGVILLCTYRLHKIART